MPCRVEFRSQQAEAVAKTESLIVRKFARPTMEYDNLSNNAVCSMCDPPLASKKMWSYSFINSSTIANKPFDGFYLRQTTREC